MGPARKWCRRLCLRPRLPSLPPSARRPRLRSWLRSLPARLRCPRITARVQDAAAQVRPDGRPLLGKSHSHATQLFITRVGLLFCQIFLQSSEVVSGTNWLSQEHTPLRLHFRTVHAREPKRQYLITNDNCRAGTRRMKYTCVDNHES